jgi:hypothetical protein
MAKLGKRAGLKHPWASALEGSIPSPGTQLDDVALPDQLPRSKPLQPKA